MKRLIIILSIVVGINLLSIAYIFSKLPEANPTNPEEILNHTHGELSYIYEPEGEMVIYPEPLKLENYPLTSSLHYCFQNTTKIDFSKQKESSFEFQYVNYNFTYKINLFKNLYKFSEKLKKQNCYTEINDNYSIDRFLKDPYNNYFMQSISEDFESLKNNFTDDEIVEIATTFVQSFLYSTDDKGNKYPYETFYDGNGNCLDKSIILADILKHLNYTTYIILGNSSEGNHAIVGIQCNSGIINYQNSLLCPIETTMVYPIGFKTNLNMTINKFVKISDGEKIYRFFNQTNN